MLARQLLLPIALLALAGCDRITGADQKKTLDAEAIGYACRISLKTPEDCMKENESQSPTSVLFGWKEADKDIKEKAVDPSMGKHQPAPQAQPGTAGEGASAVPAAPAEAAGKAAESAAATGKGAPEKKAGH